MYIETLDSIDKINYAIAIPKELYAPDGSECRIFRWAFDMVPNEVVQIQAAMFIDKQKAPEYLIDNDKRMFHASSWEWDDSDPVVKASMTLRVVNPEETEE